MLKLEPRRALSNPPLSTLVLVLSRSRSVSTPAFDVALRGVALRCGTLCFVVLCCIPWFHVTFVVTYYIMLCDVTLCYIPVPCTIRAVPSFLHAVSHQHHSPPPTGGLPGDGKQPSGADKNSNRKAPSHTHLSCASIRSYPYAGAHATHNTHIARARRTHSTHMPCPSVPTHAQTGRHALTHTRTHATHVNDTHVNDTHANDAHTLSAQHAQHSTHATAGWMARPLAPRSCSTPGKTPAKETAKTLLTAPLAPLLEVLEAQKGPFPRAAAATAAAKESEWRPPARPRGPRSEERMPQAA